MQITGGPAAGGRVAVSHYCWPECIITRWRVYVFLLSAFSHAGDEIHSSANERHWLCRENKHLVYTCISRKRTLSHSYCIRNDLHCDKWVFELSSVTKSYMFYSTFQWPSFSHPSVASDSRISMNKWCGGLQTCTPRQSVTAHSWITDVENAKKI